MKTEATSRLFQARQPEESPLKEKPDQELRRIYRGGDAEAFRVYFSRHRRRVYSFLLLYGGSTVRARVAYAECWKQMTQANDWSVPALVTQARTIWLRDQRPGADAEECAVAAVAFAAASDFHRQLVQGLFTLDERERRVVCLRLFGGLLDGEELRQEHLEYPHEQEQEIFHAGLRTLAEWMNQPNSGAEFVSAIWQSDMPTCKPPPMPAINPGNKKTSRHAKSAGFRRGSRKIR